MDIAVPSSVSSARSPGVLRLQLVARVLRQHAALIVLCALIAAALAYAAARTAPKVYTATTAITVEGEKFNIPELQGALRTDSSPDPMPWVRTEVQALTARSLLDQVVGDLHLDTDPEWNPALRPPTLFQQAKDRISALVLPLLPAGPAEAPSPGPDEAVISSVAKSLSAFQDNRSLVIALSFTSQDPRVAAAVLNTLVGDYVKNQANQRNLANESASAILAKRIEQARADLAAIEDRMQALRSKGELVGLRAGSVGQQQAEDLATAAARATLERSQLEVNYARATAAAKGGSSDALVAVLNSPTISRLRDGEATASRRLAELSARYGPSYPGIQSARAELSSTRSQISDEAARIVASLGAQLRAAREQETEVQRQLDAARKSGVLAENSKAELTQLQAEATTRRTLYQTLLERAQQTTAQPTGSDRRDVRVISAAVPPGSPSGPNVKLTTLMGGAGGALLGACIALMRIRRSEAVDDASDITDVTGVPVLATLSRRQLRPGQGLLGTNPRTNTPDLETMRQLRERLRFSRRAGSPRSAVIVPIQDAPLAARAAVALARAAASTGERVLLVEGALDQPVMGKLLGSPRPGLMQVLRGEDWQDAVVDQNGLGLLLAGPDTGRAGTSSGSMGPGSVALGGVALHNLLAEASGEYDLVVLNAPLAASASASSLVQWADLAVLLVEEKTGPKALQEAVAQLGATSRTAMVAVLVTGS